MLSEILELDPNTANASLHRVVAQEYLCKIAGEDDRAENFKRTGQAAWQAYQNNLPKNTPENTKRIGLPPMQQLREDEFWQLSSQLTPQAAAYLQNILGVRPRAPVTPPPNPSPPPGGGRT